MDPIDLILSRIKGWRKVDDGWRAPCPAHEDKTPSLSIKEADDGAILLNCHGQLIMDCVVVRILVGRVAA